MTPFVCLLRIKIHSMAWKNILGIASHYTAVICKLDDFIACSDLKIATVFVTTCVEYILVHYIILFLQIVLIKVTPRVFAKSYLVDKYLK